MELWSRLMWQRGGIIAIPALALYVATAPAHLSSGDNAEFAALSATGGVAHPTGYPLYVLWLRAWSWLPVETPALAAAYATCLLAGAMLVVLHAACRAWGATPPAASFAVALIAGTPLVVRLGSEAEVFAMNALVGASVLWLSAEAGPLRGTRRAVALGLVAGLGISNHLTCIFLAPIGLLGVVRGVRESQRSIPVVAGLSVAALVMGLAPYCYLLVAPDTRASWGTVDDLHELVRHFLRMDYGGPGELGPRDLGGTPGANVLWLLTTHARAFLWAPLALAVVALVCGVRQRGPSRFDTRAGWILLAVSWLVAGPLLIARFNLPPDGAHAFVTQRFHMLPLVVLAIPVAVGTERVGSWVLARAPQRLRRPRIAITITAISMVTLVAVSLPDITAARSWAIERALTNMLETLPENAVVIGTPDEFHFGMAYLQGARGIRPDVVILAWPQVGLSYARERFAAQTGIRIEPLPPESPEKLSVVVAGQILATGRPLFIDPIQANIATTYPCYPYGLLFRVLPKQTPLPSTTELFAINKELYARFKFGYPTPRHRDFAPAMFHAQYTRTWHILADALAQAGMAQEREYALRMFHALVPED